MINTLADILAPMAPEHFFAEYYDQQPLHLPGAAGKFADVLDWAAINRLLGMTHIWSERSLKVVLDSTTIPAAQYSQSAMSRDGATMLQPIAAKVQEWVARGASVVMNDVDSLTPGLAGVSTALEGAGLGKAQANIYISWQSHKAFHAHYDTHDVWAVQVEGEKIWNIWEGRAEWPVAHAIFRNQGQEFHEKAKGALRFKAHLKKGDLLYLPRGWYHDALAEAPNSVHIAYGVHAAMGVDFMGLLTERAFHDAEFRKPLPRQDGSAAAKYALTQRTSLLGQRIAEWSRDPKFLQAVENFLTQYRYQRGGYDLLAARGTAPATESGGAQVFRVRPNVKTVRRGADYGLRTDTGVLAITAQEVEPAAWIITQPSITEASLALACPGVNAAALIEKLRSAEILLPA
ncbi:MAG: cupin domain-containing protein [Alphaproteobacteria bacterium]